MKEKRIGPMIILTAFILIICSSKVIWFLLAKYVSGVNHENRQLSTRPALTWENYGTFSNEYTNYFNDNMQFREKLVTLNSLVDYYVFDESANEKVIKGKDGWLFFNATLSDYQRTNLYTKEELESIKDDVLATKKYLKDKGIEFVIFIGPNKNTIYGEYMPSYIEINPGQTRVQQMVDYLKKNTDVPIVFPVDEMLDIKKEHPELIQYLKLDTHWNYMGGFVASAPLLKALGAEPISFDDIDYYQINKPDFSWNGYDEANMLGLTDILNSDINYHISNKTIESITYEGYVPDDSVAFGNLSRVYSNARDKRKVFFIRDSFGEAITPYIAASFSEIYSIYRGALKQSQIDEEQPDILIYEAVERNDFRGCINYQNWDE